MKQIVSVFLKENTKTKMENLLLGMFTPQEIVEFEQRLEIVRLLKKGIAQHAIAEKLGVGVATVSRGAREIKMGRFKYVWHNNFSNLRG